MRFAVGFLFANVALLCGTHVLAEDQELVAQEANVARSRPVTIDVWFLKMKKDAKTVPHDLLYKAKSPDGDGVPVNRQEFVAQLAELNKKGLFVRSYHIRATTAAGQELTVHVGERKPTIRSAQRINGVARNTITYENVGTMLSATPEILSDNRLRLSVKFEDSALAETDLVIQEATDDSAPIKADRVEIFTTETAVEVRSGYPCLVTGTAGQGTGRPSGHVLVVCASVGDE